METPPRNYNRFSSNDKQQISTNAGKLNRKLSKRRSSSSSNQGIESGRCYCFFPKLFGIESKLLGILKELSDLSVHHKSFQFVDSHRTCSCSSKVRHPVTPVVVAAAAVANYSTRDRETKWKPPPNAWKTTN
ncbi:MAG: hypothetical protein MHMPM18_002711 [Marteilia pararefringens]